MSAITTASILLRETKVEESMKQVLVLMLILLLFAVGCSSSNSTGGSSGGTSSTPMEGTWSITGSVQCTQCGSGGSPSYQVAFVSSPCSVSTPVGTFSVQGSVCFIANNNSGQGSITGTGLLSSASNTGVGVLLGTSADPVSDGGTVNLLFVNGNASGFVEFTGSATVTKNAMQGTGSCSAETPVCQGTTATFSGTKQALP